MNNEEMRDFVRHTVELPHPSLVIAEDKSSLKSARQYLTNVNFQSATNWKEVVSALKAGESVFFELTEDTPPPLELEQILTQFLNKDGQIQVTDTETGEFSVIQITPESQGLSILSTVTGLQNAEKLYPIRNFVGVTQRVEVS